MEVYTEEIKSSCSTIIHNNARNSFPMRSWILSFTEAV